jgi:hypothetical protein
VSTGASFELSVSLVDVCDSPACDVTSTVPVPFYLFVLLSPPSGSVAIAHVYIFFALFLSPPLCVRCRTDGNFGRTVVGVCCRVADEPAAA